jgi:hypothetical protein
VTILFWSRTAIAVFAALYLLSLLAFWADILAAAALWLSLVSIIGAALASAGALIAQYLAIRRGRSNG